MPMDDPVGDLENVKQCDTRNFHELECYCDDTWLSFWTCNRNFMFKAEVDGKFAGYIAGEHTDTSEGGVMSIAVDKEFRRRGIGEELLQLLIQKLRDVGVNEIWLESRLDNHTANHMYRKLGFEIVEVIKEFYVSDDSDAYCWQLKLAK